MNADFRRERVKKLPAKALERIVLMDLDREYTLSEIAIITSAGPARALGLPQKGHLGVGADADVTIYNDYPEPDRMFGYPRYVIKGGEVVLEEGEIRLTPQGREFIVQPAYDEKDRGVSAAGLPAGLHDVVRQLPRGNGTHPPPRSPRLRMSET